MTRLLVLLDVDGTLFLTHDPLAGIALRETLGSSYGVELPEDAVDHVDHAGQTSLRIARLVLRDAGVEDEQITRGLATGARPSRPATASCSLPRTPAAGGLRLTPRTR